MLGGWYDVFLPWQLKDYHGAAGGGAAAVPDDRALVPRGPPARASAAMADALAWFRAHLLGDRSGLRADPVRLYVTGAERVA